MTSIEVLEDTNGGELLQRVGDGVLVHGLCVRALLDVQVGDQVGERVGLDDGHDADVGELLDLGDDLVDVVLVLCRAAVCDAELAVGRLGSAVAVGQVVDDDLDELLLAGALLDRRRVRKGGAEVGDLGDDVEPRERRDIGDARGLRLQGRVGDSSSSSADLVSIVGAEVDLREGADQ